jgi:hypothetical protein
VTYSAVCSTSTAELHERICAPYGQALVATLEAAVRLHHHRPGGLARLDRYLHHRTGGMIGSLSHLLRGAAIEAILDGSEQITKATLETVGLDYAAQRHDGLGGRAAGVRRKPARG